MRAKRTGRPPKSIEQQRSRYLQVRVTEGEKRVFDRAAELAGVDLSSWVRERLRAIARRELGAVGEEPVY